MEVWNIEILDIFYIIKNTVCLINQDRPCFLSPNSFRRNFSFFCCAS